MNGEQLEAYALALVGAAEGVFHYYVQPELTAERAWAVMGLGILAYELAAPSGELLSEGVDRALEAHRVVTMAAIGYTTLHLCNLLPEKLDLFHKATKFKHDK